VSCGDSEVYIGSRDLGLGVTGWYEFQGRSPPASWCLAKELGPPKVRHRPEGRSYVCQVFPIWPGGEYGMFLA